MKNSDHAFKRNENPQQHGCPVLWDPNDPECVVETVQSHYHDCNIAQSFIMISGIHAIFGYTFGTN
jgi:hypothetical protein